MSSPPPPPPPPPPHCPPQQTITLDDLLSDPSMLDSVTDSSVVESVISLLSKNPLPFWASETDAKFLSAVRQLTSLSPLLSQASSSLQLLSDSLGSIPPPAPAPAPTPTPATVTAPATILSVPPLGAYVVPSVTNFPAPSWSPAPARSSSLPSLGQHFVPSISDFPRPQPRVEKVTGTEFDPWDNCNWNAVDYNEDSTTEMFTYQCADMPNCPMEKVVYVTYNGRHKHEKAALSEEDEG